MSVQQRSDEHRPAAGPAPVQAARWLAARGLPVHPLAPGRKTPAANCTDCRDRSHPPADCHCHAAGRWCHGWHSATTDQTLITQWWEHEPAFGVGVACGPADLVVLDVDAHTTGVPDRGRLLPGIPIPDQVNLAGLASGYDTLALLAAYRRRPDPANDTGTLRVATPSGGLHIWYRNPHPTVRYRSSTGSSTKTALAWQVDIRAHGSYIVAPGTRTAAHGTTRAGHYRPLGSCREPAPLPGWLAAELTRTGHTPPPPAPPRARQHHADRAPAPRGAEPALALLHPHLDTITACATTPEGAAFTEKLNRAAYTAGGLCAAGHLDTDHTRTLLTDAAHHARPHQIRRNETIIDAALTAGARRPLHLKDRHE
ncbi:bifunctional DNA primase/polymerase [Streptomyces bohaiensis]|uniref:bifunctional DNA primase/polymerase n=1 Tax=Streptomyces bohaiensis TaxID=1431344 RepID=UPI003B7E1837